jgi:amidohydrolase
VIKDQINALYEDMVAVRRDLHQHPELAFQEIRTAGVIAAELRRLGFTVEEGIAVTGVIGMLDSGRSGKTLLLRFDMDALPVIEATDLAYCSNHPGVMHACGHDGHVAVGLAIASILSENKDSLQGRVLMLFQPAEEGSGTGILKTTGGAEAMILAGVLQKYAPDEAVAAHLWNGIPTGEVVIHAGAIMAGADQIQITVNGRGGHGAQPQLTADPVLAGAQILTALQSIVSRNVSPQDTVVISITMFHAGEAVNVIPAKAVLQGTMRTFGQASHELIARRITEVATQVAGAMGCTADVQINRIAPAVENSARVCDEIHKAVIRHAPHLNIDTDKILMVSEDMAFFLQKIPGCYILIGAGGTQPGSLHGHHHPGFTFDEEAMRHAVLVLAGYALDVLST